MNIPYNIRIFAGNHLINIHKSAEYDEVEDG